VLAGEQGDFVREAVAIVARELMEAEVSTEIGAGRGEVSLERTTHRNGYRPRGWETRVGWHSATPCVGAAEASSGAICYALDAGGGGAVGAAEDSAVGLDTVADHSATAVSASRGKRVDRALEAVEDMRLPVPNNLESLVVVVAANLARRHCLLPFR